MSSPIPNRININALKKSPKKGMPPVSPNFLVLPIGSEKNLPIATPSDSGIPESKLTESRSKSITNKSRLSQIPSSRIERMKFMLMQYLQDLLEEVKKKTSQKQKILISKMLEIIKQPTDFQDFLEEFFKCYDYCHKLNIQEAEFGELKMHLNLRERKRLFLVEEDNSKSQKGQKSSKRHKKTYELQKQNQQIKKQLFKCKQLIKNLERRTLILIQQFKDRKKTYLQQIQRLTSIVKTSLNGIPQLLLNVQQKSREKTKNSSKRKNTPSRKNTGDNHTNDDQYNMLASCHDFTNALSLGQQAMLQAMNNQQILRGYDQGNSMLRYKSLGNINPI